MQNAPGGAKKMTDLIEVESEKGITGKRVAAVALGAMLLVTVVCVSFVVGSQFFPSSKKEPTDGVAGVVATTEELPAETEEMEEEIAESTPQFSLPTATAVSAQERDNEIDVQATNAALEGTQTMGPGATTSAPQTLTGNEALRASCPLDKIGAYEEQVGPPNPYIIEFAGSRPQIFDYYPLPGMGGAVTYLIPALETSLFKEGFGSLWELQGDAAPCGEYPWEWDSLQYAKARLDSGHSGVVIDLRGSDENPRGFAILANLLSLNAEGLHNLLGAHGWDLPTQVDPAVSEWLTANPTP